LALASQVARADTYVSDQAAALLAYPLVVSGNDSGDLDTLIQISNTSTELAIVQCYYVNTTGTCSVSGAPCLGIGLIDIGCPSDFDLCVPNWVETDFQIFITARQPLGWRASTGLQAADLPLDGVALRGPTGQSNAGSRVPPFTEPSVGAGFGELKCYVVEADGTPSDRNILKGEATIVNPGGFLGGAPGDAAKYNAIGFRALEGIVDDDNRLVLGGEGAEYDGCPAVLILNHFFDGAANPSVPGAFFVTSLTLVPCTQNFLNQVPTRVTAQYLVFNEFEQRFSTSAPVDCLEFSILSLIDTRDPTRSIFSTNVSGTISGQTRIRGVNGGLMGVALETSVDGPAGLTSDAFNLHVQGERDASDIVTVVRFP
jgi:hypothetical protein